MTNGRTPPKAMPTRSPNLPPPDHNMAPLHEEYSQEAARAAQRYFEMTAEIAKLAGQLEEWRRRALMAEEEIKRGEVRERSLNDKLESVSERLTLERDTYKDRLTALKAEFSTAGNIILKCMQSADMLAGAPNKVDMNRLIAEIEERSGDDEPLPKVVTDGPRQD